jgi:hypothetical protein
MEPTRGARSPESSLESKWKLQRHMNFPDPLAGWTDPIERLGTKPESYHRELFNSSSSTLASFKSAVSKPSVNHP